MEVSKVAWKAVMLVEQMVEGMVNEKVEKRVAKLADWKVV